jgi:hypothetical protein
MQSHLGAISEHMQPDVQSSQHVQPDLSAVTAQGMHIFCAGPLQEVVQEDRLPIDLIGLLVPLPSSLQGPHYYGLV